MADGDIATAIRDLNHAADHYGAGGDIPVLPYEDLACFCTPGVRKPWRSDRVIQPTDATIRVTRLVGICSRPIGEGGPVCQTPLRTSSLSRRNDEHHPESPKAAEAPGGWCWSPVGWFAPLQANSPWSVGCRWIWPTALEWRPARTSQPGCRASDHQGPQDFHSRRRLEIKGSCSRSASRPPSRDERTEAGSFTRAFWPCRAC